MTSLTDLHAARDGAALKALALEGRTEAALLFSDLVCNAKYAGDANGTTKKAAKDLAREDAIKLVRDAAETGDFKALSEWASMNFEGRREPGQFGGTIMTSFYGVAEELYQTLLSHPDCPDDQRSSFLFRQGVSIQLKARIKGIDRNQEVIDLWKSSIAAGGSESDKAEHALSDLYWRLGDHANAVAHASNVLETCPYAHLTLFLGYQKGLGVAQDEAEAQRQYDLWNAKTAPKRRGKR